ncbi:uncharacterized protein [Onthophagus taurus]|uniref:uncharacterized protein n=1 Tax=Onthophagus taurus TaxID=166361 RepID=UPI0039BE2E24
MPMNTGYRKDKSTGSEEFDEVKYKSAIGALLYLCNNTRPDISASVSILAQQTKGPLNRDWVEVKRVFKYLKETIDLKLKIGYEGDNKTDVVKVYADADWASDLQDRKSNSGDCIFLNNMLVSWQCKKQQCVSLSSTEAEYTSVSRNWFVI